MGKIKYNFIGNMDEMHYGIVVLGKEYNFEVDEKGYEITLIPESDKLIVKFEDNKGSIAYGNRSHFYRALGILTEHLRDGEESICVEEAPQFDNVGIMLPVSNCPITLDGVKQFITKMAIMGYSQLLFYMEDVYELDNYPDFGYMRGRYTKEELKEIDDFGYALGVEVIPCIQTLGHLTTALQRDYAREFQDTNAVLLVGEEKTYEFIEEMVSTLAKIFRTKTIHLGMDEAFDLGYGQYFTRNGYKHRFEIFNEHLKRVNEIVKKYNLKPMVWGDMFLSINTQHGMDQLEEGSDVSDDMIFHTPKDYTIAMWNYSYRTKEEYLKYFAKYQKLNMNMVFCSSVWTWHGRCLHHPQTFKSIDASMDASKEIGIRDMFVTLWGGKECSIWTALLGLQQFAEYAYYEKPSMKHVEKRCDFCSGYKSEFFHIVSDIDIPTVTIDTDEIVQDITTPTHNILTQDPLLGIHDKTAKGFDYKTHFFKCIERLKDYSRRHPENDILTDYYIKLCEAASIKSDLGMRMKDAYDDKYIDVLKVIAYDDIPAVIKAIENLREAHYKWITSYNKRQVWQTADYYYGGGISRLRATAQILKQYIDGEIDSIEELEQEKLDSYTDTHFLVSYSGPPVRVNSTTFILTY